MPVNPAKSCSCCLTSQFEQRNFRRASVSDGQHYRSQTAIDVNLRTCQPAESLEHPLAGSAYGAALVSDRHLATVCMSTQNQIHRGPRSAPENDGIVRQQKLHFIVT